MKGKSKRHTVFPHIVSAETIFLLKVEIFILFPHYGNFLHHKLNSCRRNYLKGGKYLWNCNGFFIAILKKENELDKLEEIFSKRIFVQWTLQPDRIIPKQSFGREQRISRLLP